MVVVSLCDSFNLNEEFSSFYSESEALWKFCSSSSILIFKKTLELQTNAHKSQHDC